MELNYAQSIAEIYNAYAELMEFARYCSDKDKITITVERDDYGMKKPEIISLKISESTKRYLRVALYISSLTARDDLKDWEKKELGIDLDNISE